MADSVEEVYICLKKFHRDKKNKKALRIYLESIKWDELENFISAKLLTSIGTDSIDIMDILLSGFSNTAVGQEKKLKVTRLILKTLIESEDTSSLNSLLTPVRLELPSLSPNSLKVLSEDCLQVIRNNSDPHTTWKDILPECLRLLGDAPGVVNHSGSDRNCAEYVNQFIKSLCLLPWDPSIITPLATMFREISMSKEDHLQVVKKLCGDLDKLSPETLPPLLYQLLRLCREQNATIVFFSFSNYFSSRLYPEILPQDASHESESPDLDLIGEECASVSALSAHATCIRFAVGESCIPRHVLATLKMAARRPSTILSSPPLLHLLLSSESQRDVSIQIIKSTLTYSLMEECRRQEFTWCADCLPAQVPLETLIRTMVISSTKHCHLSTVGLLHLSVALISSWGGVPAAMLPLPYLQLKSLGKLLFVRLGRACPGSIAHGLRMLMHTPRLIQDLLESLSVNASPMLMECIPELRNIIENCLGFQHDPSDTDAVNWRCKILKAVVHTATRISSLRDTFLIMCRKGLFSREPSVGRVAVSGLLCLLKALRCPADILSQDFSGSEHSVLTQISIDVLTHSSARSKVNNGAVCMEVISQLRFSLNQSWQVREQLYKELPNVMAKRPEYSEVILEVLYEHITLRFMNSESSDMIPVNMNKCVSLRDDGALLIEPIGALLFTLQKVVASRVQDESADHSVLFNKITKLLLSFAEKFAGRTPVDFGLDDGIWICDIMPESQSRYLIVQQLLTVCEALIAFCLQHWDAFEESNVARTLLGLHRTYGQLVDFTKVSSKSKKSDKNMSMRRSQKSQTDAMMDKENRKPKGKNANKGPMKLSDLKKDRTVSFKALDTVWDVDVVYDIVRLLYSDDTEWSSEEDMTNLRTSRSLHKHLIRSSVNAVCVNMSSAHCHIDVIIKISKILYNRCLARLNDFADFDQETALVVIELFQELLSHVCNADSNERLMKFLSDVGGESETQDLSSLISQMCDCIAMQITETAEGCDNNEDPSASKIPPALLRLLTTLVAKLPSNMAACDKWTQWMVKLCSDGVKSKWVGSNIISSILSLSARSRNPWNDVEVLVEALTKIMGVNDDTNETTREEYDGVFSCLAHSSVTLTASYLALCSHLNRRLGAAELVIGRLKSEVVVIPYKSVELQQPLALALKNRERALCNELTHLVNVCKRVAVILCPPGACCTAALKLMGRLHSVLAITVQHFMSRDVTFLLNARFDRLVMSAGRRLTKCCDALIDHVEGARGGQKQGRSVVVRDTKHIPKMVYLIELFAKRIMQLDKKTKLDLMSHMSKGNARDFRIKASTIREALNKQNDGEEYEEESLLEKSAEPDGSDKEDEDVDIKSMEDEVEAVMQEEFGGSDDDGTSKADSDGSTNAASEDEAEASRPTKKKRLS